MPYNTTAIPPRKEPTGQTQLPLSRVKKIISQDPEVNMCSNNAAFIITLAAEMFIQHMAEEAHTQAKLDRKPRRNIQYKDVANTVSHQDHLEFLEDMVPKTVPLKKIKAAAAATQSRLRGETQTVDEVARPDTAHSATGGNATLIVNGDDGATSGPRVIGAAAVEEDPSQQLELEMRQAQDVRRDADVSMTG
ncbi:hypothetical protein N3K66_003400 [Trichothecium roseum]|uniref:Uncharacterized protein n=1 Tax=Trichothecium roseum TaxID=47278 RepID=A0ACC0V5C9_9HYPO|nr:hypothetical protein N3K66_003400 [Trichothecium roseum]